MCNLASYQELQSTGASDILREVDEPLINDFGPGFGGDVAAKVDIEFADNLR
jgi:hypothetical protein